MHPYRSPATRPDYSPRPTRAYFAWAFLCGALFVNLIGGAVACTKQQATAIATTVNDVAQCVVAHENEPPAQIATECGLAGAADVINLLATMDKRAADRYACINAGVKDAGGQ